VKNNDGIETINNSTIKFYGQEYFPLKKNATYKYDSNLGSTTAKTRSEGSGISLSLDSGGILYKQNLYSDSTGIYLTQVENKALFFGRKVTYNKPVLRIPFPLKIGDTWKWEGFEKHENGDVSKMLLKGKLISEETIETQAGKFNCIKLSLEIYTESSTNIMTEWLAPNIGIVKLDAKMNGGGLASLIQKFMGLSEVQFTLNKIEK
jgi:hypothetical protein